VKYPDEWHGKQNNACYQAQGRFEDKGVTTDEMVEVEDESTSKIEVVDESIGKKLRLAVGETVDWEFVDEITSELVKGRDEHVME
jgi:hypothetical protein